MQAGSTRSLEVVLEATEAALGSDADATGLGDDLFAMVRSLDSRHGMRRALTEPAVPAEAKSKLVETLVKDKIGEPAFRVVDTAVRHRWSKGRDLADSLEQASVTAHVAAAEAAGHLDDLEDNLFRFSRIVQVEAGLREALSDPEKPLDGKRALLDRLVGGKVDESTARLLGQAVAGRHQSLPTLLASYQEIAAGRRNSLVATVWVAAALTAEHKERLEQALAEQYSHKVHLNVIVEPSVLGGVRVAVGDDVIDSTVETRLKEAHRRLAP